MGADFSKILLWHPTKTSLLEFVREKWNPIFPKRQTKTREFRACLVQSHSTRLKSF
jgi:UDP-glucose 4-epimerase